MTNTILHISSSNRTGSVSNEIGQYIVENLAAKSDNSKVITRDVTTGIDMISDAWIGANFTPADVRSDEQRQALSFSDELVGEVQAADTIVIGVPIHNFSVPTALRSWIDQIARAGLTFQYTENGPEGLLRDKKVILVVAAGGVEPGSNYDFATPYMKHVLGFIGITDVEIVNANARRADGRDQKEAAREEADQLIAA